MSFRAFLSRLMRGGDDDPRGHSKDFGDWQEKRRSNRVDVHAGEKLEVHLLKPGDANTGSTLVADVRNVSLRGCQIVFTSSEERDQVRVGDVLVASLAVDEFPIPLQVEVVRWIGPMDVALRYKSPFPKELEKLERFLEPRCLGLSLREIDPAALQKEAGENLRWFQGINDTHLFSWIDPRTQAVVQQQLIFLERVIEWQQGKALKTGRIRPEEMPRSGYGWVKSEIMDFDPVVDPALLDQAKTVLTASRVDRKIKELFFDRINKR